MLKSENIKLKGELSQLQSLQGSAELIAGLRAEIVDLQRINLELEQTNSNLATELANNRREYDVKLQVYGENAKISHFTSIGESGLKSPSMVSPVKEYEIRSPEYGLDNSEFKREKA